MKKIFTLGFTFLLLAISQAQVAINNTGATANTSAMLDISNPNKGLLIPRVYLLSANDNTTIANPATSLLVYNTNSSMSKSKGFYFNSGTSVTPNWQPLKNFILPYYEAFNEAETVFYIDNYSAVISSAAIQGNAGGIGIGVEGTSSNGTGILARSWFGNALDVNGKIKITGNGQVPGAGKVLTSDANGNASWEGAVAFSANGMKMGGSDEISTAVETKLAFGYEMYDLGNNYNNALVSPHSTFTAPVRGIYHFDVQISWLSDNTTGWRDLRLIRKRNGVNQSMAEESEWVDMIYLKQQLSIDIELLAGDEVHAAAYQNSGDVLRINSEQRNTWFNGRLVVKL